jgi:glycosyltransferase involved in cell wall biosynthesis
MEGKALVRILHISPYFYPAWAYGGTCRAAWEVARPLAARGHTVSAYTTDAFNAQQRAKPAFEVVEKVAIHRARNLSNRLAWNRIFLPLTFTRELAKACAQADVVHLHEYRSYLNVVVLPILRRTQTPFIVTPQGSLPVLGRSLLKSLYDPLVGKALLHEAAALHATSPMERNQFLEAGAEAGRIQLLPNGIDVEDYAQLAGPGDFRARHEIPPEVPLVLFLARINRIKGVDFLVSAFAQAAKALPEAVLALVGPDDGYLAQVKRQVSELGLGQRVRYIGYLAGAEKLQAYQAADVYVLPSNYEILGITLLEALACGTPVITTDKCGLAPTLAEAGLGTVVQFGEVASLSDALLKALQDRVHMRQEGERRRAYVLSHFSWEKIADSWESVYAQCARKR